MHVTPSFETENVTDETVNGGDAVSETDHTTHGTVNGEDLFGDSSTTAAAAQAEIVTDDDVGASWAAEFATDSGAGGGGGGGGGGVGAGSASVKEGAAQSTGPLTVRVLTAFSRFDVSPS